MLELYIMNNVSYKIVGFQKLAKASLTANSKLKVNGYIIRFISSDNPTVVHSTIRQPKQILLDLIGSGRLPSTITDWEDARVHRAVARMNNKIFDAEINFHKAGDTYLATETSSAVIDGTAKIGDKLTYKQDGCNFVSFINCMKTEEELDREDRNEMIATLASRQFGQFNDAFGADPFSSNPFGSSPVIINHKIDDNNENGEGNTGGMSEEELKALASE